MPATRDGAATLPSEGKALFRPFHGPAFRQLYTKVTSSTTSNRAGMNFSLFTVSFVTTFVFRIAVWAVTVCPRQFVLNDFGCLKGGKVFLLLLAIVFSSCKKTDGPSSRSGSWGIRSASCSASLKDSAGYTRPHIFHWMRQSVSSEQG